MNFFNNYNPKKLRSSKTAGLYNSSIITMIYTSVFYLALFSVAIISINLTIQPVAAYKKLHSLEYKKLKETNTANKLLDPHNKDGFLEPILKVRIPDTQGSLEVQDHLKQFFQKRNEELEKERNSKKKKRGIGNNSSSSISSNNNNKNNNNNIRRSPIVDDDKDANIKKEKNDNENKEFQENLSTGNWTLEVDSFQEDTPITKNVTFTNLIFTRDPPGAVQGSVGRLSLVAHYDSKIEPKGFIGAIDSAFPCALMMYIVQALDAALTQYWESTSGGVVGNETGLQIIFLDGEEAFHSWSETDSTYGARHLAKVWESPDFHVTSSRRSMLESIDLFVLMDLLGAHDTTVRSYYRDTDWVHAHLNSIEKLYQRDGGKSSNKKNSEDGLVFPRPRQDSFHMASYLSDDHLPFIARGVPVLHLIPLPFPSVWHTMDDDGDHLDADSMYNLSLIMTAFVAEYMGITGHLGVDITNSDL